MGRRKIAIQAISESKIRHNTFNKRKNGLVKKAAELSMLCNIKMLLMFEDLHGNLVQYSTHGNYEPKKYFLGCKTPHYLEFTSSNYPVFFKGLTADKKDSKCNSNEKEPADEMEELAGVVRNGDEQFESLEANVNSAMSLVEKLNTARIGRIDIKDENISNGENRIARGEERLIDKTRKQQKQDDAQQKLEYQSDSENFEEKIAMDEEFAVKLSQSQSNGNSKFDVKSAMEGQDRTKITPPNTNTVPANQLQAMTLNYALNALQNPMNPLLLHNNENLLELTKSMLIYSTLRQTNETPVNLSELLLGEGQTNLMNASQSNRNLDSAIAQYLASQRANQRMASQQAYESVPVSLEVHWSPRY